MVSEVISLSNPVAAGLSRIQILNLTRGETVQNRVVLEVYDGEDRLQVEFEDVEHFRDVTHRDPEAMMTYFEENLFEGPRQGDPEAILLSMAARAGEEGLVTVPPEQEDEQLFETMTRVFQNAADRAGATSRDGGASGDFLQNLLREQSDGGEESAPS